MFGEVLNDLCRDAEALPTAGPVQPSPEFLRALDRKQLIAERVDAEGIGHPQVFGGDTDAGWRVRDLLRRQS